MSDFHHHDHHHLHGGKGRKGWSEWAPGVKGLVILAGLVVVAGLLALCSAVAMWLWNALLPGIFKLPEIGFWQAAGLLVLAQLFFKGGGTFRRIGRSRWRAARLRDFPEGEPEDLRGAEPGPGSTEARS